MINKDFALLLMLFFHVVDDYYLQGILASMKQKHWWRKQPGYCLKYKYDYVAALLFHSFSWSFMIMLPIALLQRFDVSFGFRIAMVVNMIVHCIVDDLKANKRKINLCHDQTIHLLQIIVTYIIFV